MRRTMFLIVSVVFALGLIACAKTENTNNSNSTTTTAGTPAAPKTGTETAATSTGDKIGVPECDDYIAKYESCLRNKVPEVMRAQLESALKTSRENWKKAAANEQTKGTLAAACKQASDAAAASMKAYGCTW